jgi:hypothetical protein
MNQPDKTEQSEKDTKANIINLVKTPLNFFVLVILIVEVVFGISASISSGSDKTYLIVGMLILIFLLVLIVAGMAFFRPASLYGIPSKSEERKIQPNQHTIKGHSSRKEVVGLSSESYLALDYGIKIETPQAGEELRENVEVMGSYIQQPPDGTLRLFTVSSDGRFWPQKIVRFDMSKHKWYGSVSLGGDRAYGMKIAVAIVGQPTRILWDYYYKVILKKNGSVSIEGWHPDDAVICDEVGITRV